MLSLALKEITEQDRTLVGGKSYSLARLIEAGVPVPKSICITTEAYRQFMTFHGLGERISLELNRKYFADMRWEELWDAALRIRNMFLTLPVPERLSRDLARALGTFPLETPLAIRSSASDEDARATSFAGLHESFINIKGISSAIDHIKLVWASLWSDAALLYRQELGLSVDSSRMAVLVQEIVLGEVSGILFTESPTDRNRAVIEAVHGLNQGLVDGFVEPDRWTAARRDGTGIELAAEAHRDKYMVADEAGTMLVPLPIEKKTTPPLDQAKINYLLAIGRKIEALYGCPQDIEWTFAGTELTILQARPITTVAEADSSDQRSWYLSLHRSYENLLELQHKIEKELLPAMAREAAELAGHDLAMFSEVELAAELERRHAIHEKWLEVYRHDFIPFAHGMRLFGQIYNDTMRPENPYQFVDLLVHTSLESTARNSLIDQLARSVRQNPTLRQQLEKGETENFQDQLFSERFTKFTEKYGDLSCSLGIDSYCRSEINTLLAVVLEIATKNTDRPRITINRATLEEEFLDHFPPQKRREAKGILELGRASYRLRDDDNIYLGRIEQQLAAVLAESRKRLNETGRLGTDQLTSNHEIVRALKDVNYRPVIKKASSDGRQPRQEDTRARQLLGQPAGPGVARGRARVVYEVAELAKMKKGEVLVCDAVEPNMTFVVPLAAAIVERRGGMLIHGAIIAREYGIACVTGIKDATTLISTGDEVTVDGYLGIVTISAPADGPVS